MMKSSLLYLAFISTLYSNSSLAMDHEAGDVLVVVHSSPVVRDLEAQVNLNENVPGCVDNYFRFAMSFWQIAEGWIDLGTILTTATGTFLTGLSTLGDLSEDTRTSLGIAAVVCGGSATFLHSLKTYSIKAIQDRKNSLAAVIAQSNTTTPNTRAS